MTKSRQLFPGEPPAVPILYRALDQALDLLDQLPMNDTRRGELAHRIRALEDAIDAYE